MVLVVDVDSACRYIRFSEHPCGGAIFRPEEAASCEENEYHVSVYWRSLSGSCGATAVGCGSLVKTNNTGGCWGCFGRRPTWDRKQRWMGGKCDENPAVNLKAEPGRFVLLCFVCLVTLGVPVVA